ncbi:putative ABC transporter, AAA+ ATPase domain, ABC-2 type transporter [Helianthus annuus]|uniref:AAA+ ATPase domain, pigment permease/Protein ATP-binding cassette sub-family G n=1 Tax=Helianthus annuus TaxID=4232 RepID=A0A251TAC6_HELAN|nr:ABC transporter G family member 11 [Helianthus annuus]KAF5781112.1 putative AAA+ ATPase domain, pigment precursor permease/Protein ATP-binding cassette sub-family G [Helianthus annuus]KAJ0500787.1 putative ABC transporter, AAA+ ATPase domain, ABC-2 type transporter [Helianthus annuus]KAJ0516656.1 putative ABC transporter, AAA+ ATPase domain, ABC-2 type transporter [Helianthus annuus]KAJ0684661.1 putative ABC transporter, AAA+ ATPase domain, ABC-2 type transporter [Helianthus annuus]KAJ06886
MEPSHDKEVKKYPQEVEITSHAPALPNHEELQRSSRSNGDLEGDTFNDGVCLTWKDLWVMVRDGQTGGSRSILQGVTGYARPGEILAIMGPSGSGKSTLLDALAGRLDPKIRKSGDILVNGVKKTLAYGTSAYVTQDDTLITTLTVRESIYYSAQLQLPDSMSKSEKKERAEMTIKEMGLQDSMDTRIGGWGAKGLSGGQKRRVSICIEILTRPKLLFLDEPTSGLDSAASYYVMSRIARLDQHEGRTIIASIHQPCSEVFGLFHNLCLLSSGRTVYFGKTSSANDFFSLNGFPCPNFQNPSDHFLRTINKDFDEDIELGTAGRKPTEEAINILIDSYKSSTTYQDVNNQVSEICKKGDVAHDKNKDHASFSTQSLVLTRRSFLNMHRDLGYYWLRLAIYIALSLGLGTIFYNVGSSYSSIQARSSLLMFVATFLTFMAIGGFPSFVEDMKVFERERLNGHYSTGAFVIANTLSSVPYLFLVSVIPGAIAYYLSGLREGLDHFAYYISVLFSCMLVVESLMMIVASVVPNYLMGIIMGSGIQGFMMLGGGFFRLPNDLPHPFWKYPLFYIEFHKYAYQGLFKNEFEGVKYVYSEAGVQQIMDGDQDILREKWQVEMGYSKWIDLLIILGMAVISRILFMVIIMIVEKVKSGLMAVVFSIPEKQKVQVMINPLATPSH